jgi:hypothetical protein
VSGLIRLLSNLQSHVFLINSRLGHFTAAPDIPGRPFSRSYRTILPSSLAMIHSSALVYSTRPPVSVYGTGSNNLMLRGFSRKPVYGHYPLVRRRTVLSGSTSRADLPTPNLSTPFNVLFRQYAGLSLFRHPIAVIASTGILTSYPSTAPFGWALGPD